ncbi:unnamed protein product [Cylindrotheca closterium]|uniref:Uncharacterized protein n=1 Tax=Cylindrotheca closterium TaxID=2856 RepID=A0AAD2CUZ0_9STRA|nr:unnamed protein product [Cylindrotheca closterium]
MSKRTVDNKSKQEGWIDWRTSSARAKLLEDLHNGTLPLEATELTAKNAWVFYQNKEGFENVVFAQFKARLADHRKQVKDKKAGVTGNKKKGWIDWRSNAALKAKNTITEDLVQGILPLEENVIPVEDLWTHYENEAGFEKVCFDQFKERLEAHREQVKTTLARSRYEEECLRHDRILFPREEVDDNGIPFFDLHPAKKLLEDDVAANKHASMKPEQLRQTREEYKVFPNSYFRPRIYQAVRKLKFINYLNYAREVKDKMLRSKQKINNEEEIDDIRKELFAVRRKKQKVVA